jgi:hypothetical protein
MNDFTREELVSTIECLKLYGDSFFCGLSAYEALIDKLQTMIDNYCEILIPKMDKYCCMKCHEILLDCECEV